MAAVGTVFSAQKAVREAIYAKIALMGASGSGKSYTALLLAKGMAKVEEKRTGKPCRILVGNTEKGRGRLYADEFDYEIVDLQPPYTPESMIEFVKWAEKEGFGIVILDSTSHEWIGEGGALELHQKAGGTFQSWGKVTPRHDKFITALAEAETHIIACIRAKETHEMLTNEKGEKKVIKVGLTPQQRDGFEYEFMLTFLFDNDHYADVQKDNTHLFDEGDALILKEEHGAAIAEWAAKGSEYVRRRNAESLTVETDFATIKAEVVTLCKELGGTTNTKLMAVLKSYDPSGNPNKIKETDKMSKLLAELKSKDLSMETIIEEIE